MSFIFFSGLIGQQINKYLIEIKQMTCADKIDIYQDLILSRLVDSQMLNFLGVSKRNLYFNVNLLAKK